MWWSGWHLGQLTWNRTQLVGTGPSTAVESLVTALMPARGGGAENEAIGLAEGLPGAAGREAEASRDASKWLQQSHGQPEMWQARDEETQDAFPQTPMLPSLEPLFPVTLTSFALNITLKIILRCSCVCPVLQDVASFAASPVTGFCLPSV